MALSTKAKVGIGCLGTIAVLVGAYTAGGFWGVPAGVKWALTKYADPIIGGPVTVQDVDFNPYTLHLNIKGLDVHKTGEPVSLINIDEIDTKVDWQSVTKLSPIVKHLSIDGFKAYAVRTGLSEFNFSSVIDNIQKMTAKDPSVPEPAPDPNAKPLKFAVGNISISNSSVTLDDRYRGKFDQLTHFNFSIPMVSNFMEDIDNPVTPKLSFRYNGKLLSLDANSLPFKISQKTGLDLDLKDLNLENIASFNPIRLNAEVRNGTLSTKININFANDAKEENEVRRLRLIGTFSFRDLLIADVRGRSPKDLVKIAALDIDLKKFAYFAQEAEIGEIKIVSPEITVVKDDKGINLADIAANPIKENPFAATPSEEAAAEKVEAETGEPPAPWKWSLEKVTIEKGNVHFNDTTVGFSEDVTPIDIEVGPLSSEPGTKTQLDLALGAAGGTVKSAGTFTLDPIGAEVTAKLDQLDSSRLAPYVEQFLNGPVTGVLSSDGSVTLAMKDSEPDIQYKGSLQLKDVSVKDAKGNIVTALGSLNVDGIEVNKEGDDLTAKSNVQLSNFTLRGQGGGEVVGVNGLAVNIKNLSLADKRAQIGMVRVNGPRAVVIQTAKGMNLTSLAPYLIKTLVKEDTGPHKDPYEVRMEEEAKAKAEAERKAKELAEAIEREKAEDEAADRAAAEGKTPAQPQEGTAEQTQTAAAEQAPADQAASASAEEAKPAEQAPAETPKPTQVAGSDQTRPAAVESPATAAKPAEQVAAKKKPTYNGPWRWSLDGLAVNGGNIRYTDMTKGFSQTISGLNVTTGPINDKLGLMKVAASLGVLGGSVSVNGTVNPNPVSVDMNVKTQNIDITQAAPYYRDMLAGRITQGRVSNDGHVNFVMRTASPIIQYNGNVQLNNFALTDAGGAPVVSLGGLNVSGINFKSASTMSVGINNVSLTNPNVSVIKSPSGVLNVTTLAKSSGGSSGGASSGGGGGGLPPVTVGSVSLNGGTVHYVDQSGESTFKIDLTRLNGKFTNINTANKSASTGLNITGDINGSPLSANGFVRPFADSLSLSINAKVTGMSLPPFSPYSIQYTGYPIKTGQMNYTGTYNINADALSATNNIVINKLNFGEVSPTAKDTLPVKLAVALLADRSGKIDLDLPITGSLSDPQFSIAGIIFKVIGNIIVKAVTAPFSLIAAMFGGNEDEDLSNLIFAPGESEIIPVTAKHLAVIGKAMADRPGLEVKIQGKVNAKQDSKNLKETVLTKQMIKALYPGKAAAKAPKKLTDAQQKQAIEKLFAESKAPKKPEGEVDFEKKKAFLEESLKTSGKDLQELADDRSKTVRQYLIRNYKIEPTRLFIVRGEIGADSGCQLSMGE